MTEIVLEAPRVELGEPNAFDYKQIERGLEKRKRYRYVTPRVHKTAGGFRIESPCCSRRIDPAGGTVDIALVQYLKSGGWRLSYKDHDAGAWMVHGTYERLADLLGPLLDDPQRLFWQ